MSLARRGIGLAIAERFSASGAKVAIWDVDGAAAAATSRGVENATYDIVDVTDPVGIARAVEATEAYVILHEAAHFVLAPSERRWLVDFGLGPGPDTRDRDAAAHAAVLSPLVREEDEAAASLLGIIWEAQLGQPALASFLDQNWLEGLDRSAHSHFAAVLGKLQRRGLLDPTWPAVFDRATTHRSGRAAAARTAEPGCKADPSAEARGQCAELTLSPRPARPASMRRSFGPPDTRSLRGGSPDLPSEPPSQPPLGRPPVKHGIGIRVPSG